MKSNLNITLTNAQLKEIFGAMSIADCTAAISYLRKRVKEYEASKIKAKTHKINLNEEFLNLPVEGLGFTNRSRCTLVRNQILTIGLSRISVWMRLAHIQALALEP